MNNTLSDFLVPLLDNEISLITMIALTTQAIFVAIEIFGKEKKRKKASKQYEKILEDSLSKYSQLNKDAIRYYIDYTLQDKDYEEYTRMYNRRFNMYYDDLLRIVSKLNASQKKMQGEFEKVSLLLSSTGLYNNASTNQQGIDAVVMLKQISEMANIDNLLMLMQDQTENKLVVTNNVISEIAHTIRTPMSGIHAILLMIEKNGIVDEKMREYILDIRTYLEQIEENLQAYRALMTRTLDEQISGEQNFHEKLSARLKGSILSCNKRLYIDCSEIHPIETDNEICNLLLLALDCIVENATVFANDNSTIRISGKSEEDYYTFIVENDGPQIGDDIASKVFNHGFSTHSSSGKGLFLVKRVIQERLGGAVDFENIKEPNEGVRFVIALEKSKLNKKERTDNGQDINPGK